MSESGRPSRPTFDAVQVGDLLPGRDFALLREDLVRYAGASGDLNPIHWNARVATEVGLPDVIAHGMLTMATAARVVTDWCGDPGAVIEYGTRFTSTVPVPDDGVGARVTVSGTVASRDEQARTVRVDLVATCRGERVLGKAQAVVRLP
ncbi:MAG: MaoC family dehydratase N-terminal domain-containing protein [Kineosporiaceae bacterium]|nr:MaoC family dehydratase N-terminal domain-containing protein [Kineosporiaceae bacterium]